MFVIYDADDKTYFLGMGSRFAEFGSVRHCIKYCDKADALSVLSKYTRNGEFSGDLRVIPLP